jgi:single-stranded-DNA-specific exonuclease
MEKYDMLEERIKESASYFKKIDKDGPIRVVSHLDCDGISSASILIRALENENLSYELSIVQQLSADFLDELKEEKHKVIFFTDLGSGNIEVVAEKLKDKVVFVLDHHKVSCEENFPNIHHANPHLFGINGDKEISGAGTVFLFCKELNEKNKMMAHIAVIGAIGDVQENKGFIGLNSEILKIAEENGLIKAKKGLRIFGRSRQLHKMLEYSSDIFIPGVTGSESGAIQLLHQAGINPMNENGNGNNSDFKRLIDLSEEEEKRLAAAIIMRRLNEKNPEDIFGFNYSLPNERYDNLRDAKEFATLLNSAGRLGNASIGIGVCLGNEEMKKKAISGLSDYKKEIVSAMNWFNDNKTNNKDIVEENGYVIINAKENIRSTIAGTLASIISKSNNYRSGKLILSMAKSEDGIKISLRINGNHEVDLKEVLKEIVDKTGYGETGGHKNAAGAMIPHSKENDFLINAKKILEEKSQILKNSIKEA